MPDEPPGARGGPRGRDGRRVALACCCLLAVVLAAGTLPAMSSPLGAHDQPGEVGPVSQAVGGVVEDALGGEMRGAGVGQELRMDGIDRYNNPADRVLFTVDADRPAYWRASSYDTYDHDGWIRSTEFDATDVTPRFPSGETLDQRITFETEMDHVPAAYRGVVTRSPVPVSRDSGGGLALDGTVHSGQVVEVQSVRPVTDEAALAAHDDWTYPSAVEERYTALPRDVPDRVHERTDEITAGADDPHETAVAIERWLRENRNYSLQVSPPEGDVADELLFERQEAHCVYFATTMVVMLRSEGVPARFVTGYTTGEPVDGSYVVRERNAHAWVEVYYPGRGWVPFDPTPPSSRASALDAASADVVEPPAYDPAAREDTSDAENGTDPTPPENGTDPTQPPNGTDPQPPANGTDPTDPGGTEPGEPDNGTDPGDPTGPGGGSSLSVALGSDPVPGESLTVTVTEGGEPASGLVVTFNGERVGTTDQRGRVTGDVPYADRLEIDVVREQHSAKVAPASDTRAAQEGSGSGDGSVTVDLPTDVEIAVEGAPLAGEPVRIVARLAGRPVADAAVVVDGERVGTTDDDGRATIRLPADGNATVRVVRGAATGDRRIEAAGVDLAVEAGGFALPFRATTIHATADGEPVAGVPVLVDGERVATTDANGTATVGVPPSGAATVALGGDGQLAETTLWPLPTLLGTLVLVATTLGIVGALAWAVDRHGLPDADALAGAIATRLVTGLVAASGGLDGLLDGREGRAAWLAHAARPAVGSVRGLARRALRVPGRLGGQVATWVAALLGREPPGRAATGPSSVDLAAGVAAETPGEGSGGGPDAAALVARTWYALVDALPVTRPETRTPAELADRAVEVGFPERTVAAVLAAFRSVAYGGREPPREEAERIHAALGEGGHGSADDAATAGEGDD